MESWKRLLFAQFPGGNAGFIVSLPDKNQIVSLSRAIRQMSRKSGDTVRPNQFPVSHFFEGANEHLMLNRVPFF